MDFMLFRKYPIIPVFLSLLQTEQQKKITVFFFKWSHSQLQNYIDKIQKKATCT